MEVVLEMTMKLMVRYSVDESSYKNDLIFNFVLQPKLMFCQENNSTAHHLAILIGHTQ